MDISAFTGIISPVSRSLIAEIIFYFSMMLSKLLHNTGWLKRRPITIEFITAPVIDIFA